PVPGKRPTTSSILEYIDKSPWGTFRKYYNYDLVGPVTVYVRSSGDCGVWAIYQYLIKDTDNVLWNLRSICYRNLVSIRECFCTPDILYILANNFYYISLDCSSILINLNRHVKIDRAVGIDNLDCWKSCLATIEFLCTITSASSFEELKEGISLDLYGLH
ncbi:hypothetical protein N7533_013287, partial [Penicillium manginii]|uniref:uncharacterized protein n=1 Tax=Penicillium manginii TaxID=203109 RepID=UPI002548ADEC